MNAKELRQLHQQIQELDEKDCEVSSWEASFLQSLLTREPERWTDRQIEVAKELVEKYRAEKRGEQEVIVKYPPGTEKYFKRRE